MGLTPEHRQEEWYQAIINSATGKYLPTISPSDAGKVMTVESDGSWGVESVPQELPSASSEDIGKVLTVNSNSEPEWQTPSSGGSCLPTPTADDVGKVATVVGETSKGAVIVPEQSVTVSKAGATLTDADASLFVDGASVIVTIDGAEYLATVETVDSSTGIAVEGYANAKNLFVNEYDGALIAGGTSNTITLSINLASISVAWGMGDGLPTPTAEDVGKVVTVVSETVVGDTIVPEQRVVFDEGSWYNCTNTNASLFVDGETVIVTITSNNTTVERTAAIADGSVVVKDTDGSTNITISKDGDVIKCKEPAGPYIINRTLTVQLQATTIGYGLETPQSGGGVLVVNFVDGALDKTWQEIHDALLSGGVAVKEGQTENVLVVGGVYVDRGVYYVGDSWSASSADGYPTVI